MTDVNVKIQVTIHRTRFNKFRVTVKGMDKSGAVHTLKTNWFPDEIYHLEVGDKIELEIGE